MRHPDAEPSLGLSLIPPALLIALLVVNVAIFRDDSSYGPNQMALLFSAIACGALGHFVLKIPYGDLEGRAIKSIVLAMEALIILIIVGALIGLWIAGGIVPTIVFYGVQFISPPVFLLVSCLTCSVVALAIGSSWSTMGTVGVALIGVGEALGVPLGLSAGAIISGAYFGDKMSPLSDTTNLAPAVAGSKLFIHIRHMLYTTIPAYVLALALFAAAGAFISPDDYDGREIPAMLDAISGAFTIHWFLLVVPLIVIVIAALRTPAIPSLMVGVLLGALCALLFQRGQYSADGGFSLTAWYAGILDSAYSGFVLETGNDAVDALLSRGGMTGMFGTISLIITAMLFGGMMEATGMLRRLAEAALGFVRGAGSLIAATVGSAIFFNIFAAEQYLSIVVPGRMFRESYERYNLDPRNLSRALEDGGTVTSVLIPWNTCGAFAASALGVSTFTYAPFAFFNLLCPLVAFALAAMHVAIVKTEGTTESID